MGAAFALVHSPLVGPGCWRPVEAAIVRSGGAALAIDYNGVEEADGYVGAAERIAEGAAGAGKVWILVVHSAAGALAPAVAQAAGAALAGVLFVDAVLPRPGRSWLETAPPALAARVKALAVAGRVPPWNRWSDADPARALIADDDVRAAFERETPSLPLTFLAERSPLLSLPDAISKGFLRLSMAYDAELQEALTRSWVVGALWAHHLAMLTEPDRVAGAIATMAAAMFGE